MEHFIFPGKHPLVTICFMLGMAVMMKEIFVDFISAGSGQMLGTLATSLAWLALLAITLNIAKYQKFRKDLEDSSWAVKEYDEYNPEYGIKHRMRRKAFVDPPSVHQYADDTLATTLDYNPVAFFKNEYYKKHKVAFFDVFVPNNETGIAELNVGDLAMVTTLADHRPSGNNTCCCKRQCGNNFSDEAQISEGASKVRYFSPSIPPLHPTCNQYLNP